jgi:hypothetical protein
MAELCDAFSISSYSSNFMRTGADIKRKWSTVNNNMIYKADIQLPKLIQGLA